MYLRNYLFVREARIAFDQGLCAITGETGAGKSVLVGAISLLFGDNSQSYEAFDPEESIYLEATFDISNNSEAEMYLSENGYEDEGDLILAREINSKGKSQYYIYGRKTSATLVKDIKPLLVDFHHQRDQQKLLNSAYQLDILDAYGGLQEDVEAFRVLYLQLKSDQSSYLELQKQEEQNRQLYELYRYQLEELEKIKLKPEEDSLLNKEFELLSAASEISSISDSLYAELYESEDSCYDKISKAISQIDRFAELHPQLEEIRVNLSIALENLGSGTLLLRNVPELLSLDGDRLQSISQRLDAINTLMHKHKVQNVLALVATLDRLRQQIDLYSSLEADMRALETKMEGCFQELLKLADKLTEERRKMALELCNELEQNIRLLSIPEGIFEIRIDKKVTDRNIRREFIEAVGEKGQDRIEFQFCANPGSSLKPLGSVASGGELSRILLAIKKVLTQSISPRLLILDEIDSGIGGKTADMIAGFIKELSHRHSVLCITHLAQIAAQADQHIALNKYVKGKVTEVMLQTLKDSERRNEIARMLSGSITEYSLKHADELLVK